MTGVASLWPVFLVGVGGTLGALSRFLVDTWLGGTRGVVVVNVGANYALGFTAAMAGIAWGSRR